MRTLLCFILTTLVSISGCTDPCHKVITDEIKEPNGDPTMCFMLLDSKFDNELVRIVINNIEILDRHVYTYPSSDATDFLIRSDDSGLTYVTNFYSRDTISQSITGAWNNIVVEVASNRFEYEYRPNYRVLVVNYYDGCIQITETNEIPIRF